MVSLTQFVFVGFVAAILIHRIHRTIWLLYFHPLRKYPGPKLWSISRLPYISAMIKGKIHLDLLSIHKQYGPVARVGPNMLAFFTAQSWKDIYGRTGARSFDKDPMYYEIPVNDVAHLVCAIDNEQHARQRKLVAGGFSGDALRSQEGLVMGYVDLFIQGLEKEIAAGKGGKVDLGEWFNYTTFDITGDLMFGESFDCLKDNALHPWIKLTFASVKAVTWISAARQFAGLYGLLMKMIPKKLIQEYEDHFRLSSEKADARLKMGTKRPDFMSGILRNGFSEVHDKKALEKEKVMSRAELHSNAYLIIIAGSETSATGLSGIAYLLCTNVDKLQKLIKEIRTTFASDADITFNTTTKLPYLNAVIEEGLRSYPPVPFGMSRLVPKGGETVDGHFVPEGTQVATYHYPTYHSPNNFNLPDSFIPERWLGEDPRFADDNLGSVQPFQMGARGCLGKPLAYAEIRLILAKLLFHFDISLSSGMENWLDQESNYVWGRTPMMVKLSKRAEFVEQ
ncbi:benzoate 4-monooxygenase cytochrome P450 [Lophiotrema nucula]|uniref:Benzoate 4-monooxygenase cytochrome P450 n=1 Tax=Lophiotrema nucula TaxID=690887 RepID=A0A6A5ZKH0_9PLEO|nr:benzoate 4-monooxygenase cytochrome P450 [Lophiotrema nucula]